MSDQSSEKAPGGDTDQNDTPAPRARSKRGNRYTDAQQNDALARYVRGDSLDEIARETGVPKHTINRWRTEKLALIEALMVDDDRRSLAEMLRCRAILRARMLQLAPTVGAEEASRMLERLDSRIDAVSSALARPTSTGDSAAAGDLERVVRAFIDATKAGTNSVVPA